MLAGLSLLLLAAAGYFALRYRHDILHPGFWTNLGFAGYAIGGLYYAFFGFGHASFLNLAKVDIDRGSWFVAAMAIVIAGFIVCNLGFRAGDRRLAATQGLARGAGLINPFPELIVRFGKLCALILIALGVAYWLYFAHVIAGGISAQFANVAAYRYLAADAGMSALPFHLAYGGAELWLLLWLFALKNRTIGLLFVPLGMIIILSTGRIALANAFGFAAVTAYVFSTRGLVNWKAFAAAFAALAPINVAFYFFRQYSSYRYVGRPDDFPLFAGDPVGPPLGEAAVPAPGSWGLPDALISPELLAKASYIARSLIGGGNVPDLQQIILIVKGLFDGRLALEYGATYFDWFYNLIGSRIGSPNAGLRSVGYRILEEYFPQKVGGPTPGMIGEAILNFGPLAVLPLFAFAFLATLLYGAAVRSRSALAKLLYCKFLIGIWALFLKVDSSLLLAFLWAAVPISLCWLGLTVLTWIMRKWSLPSSAQLRGQA